MSCFLCEINSEAATSEEENESLNGSLQQGADGEETPHFKNNHISFLFFSTLPVQARIHRLQQHPPLGSFQGGSSGGVRAASFYRISAVVDCPGADYLPQAASFRPEGGQSQEEPRQLEGEQAGCQTVGAFSEVINKRSRGSLGYRRCGVHWAMARAGTRNSPPRVTDKVCIVLEGGPKNACLCLNWSSVHSALKEEEENIT